MKKGQRKFWIPALLTLLVLAAVFGCFAGQKIHAKSKLTSALNHVFSQLEERFDGDPLLILARCYHPEGQYTADLEAVTSQEPLGTITYNMRVDVDSKTHQVSADGIAHTESQEINLSLYLDPVFIAVSSDELVAGEYYGITYDTFAADIRKVPLLDFLISDTLIQRWDASMKEVQKKISKEYPQPQIPEFQEQEFRKLLLGVAAMPCQLQKTDIVMEGQTLECDELDYAIRADQTGWLLSKLAGEKHEGNIGANLSFYLYGDDLVRITLSGTAEETPFQYCVDLSLDPQHSPLTLTGSYGTSESLSVAVSTQSDENRYAESWDIHTVSEGTEQDHSFAFDWDPHSGLLNFRSGKLSAPLALVLQECENGLQLETKDLGFLMGLILQDEAVPTSRIPGVLTISKGSAIETPSYKNLDAWSMQDFLTLLASIGSLIGIRLE